MAYKDKPLQCSDYGTTLTFTPIEQELFASRGYINKPQRCSSYHQAKESERSRSSYRRQQEMLSATSPSVVTRPKCHLKPANADPYIAGTATKRLGKPNNASLSLMKFSKGGNMNIHIGNLAYAVTEEDLREEFEAFGQVASVNIVKDRRSGQSKGFAFVEMPSKTEGDAAIAGLQGKTLANRTLDVSESHPRPSSRGKVGFGGRGGSRGRSGGSRRRGGFSGGGRKRGRY